jgi:hypothetical protein
MPPDVVRRLVLLALATLILCSACASSTPMMSEQERCLRYGGLWVLETCRGPGSGM